jgi:hypothetical protein
MERELVLLLVARVAERLESFKGRTGMKKKILFT